MLFVMDPIYREQGITPVENRFILEYLPSAKGDAVRVYLYGLTCCLYPGKEMTPEIMAKELGLSEEDVLTSLRYWERRNLVRRISDKPVSYVFLPASPAETAIHSSADDDFAAFTESIYSVFGNRRRMHGSEIQTCYEWVEELKLPKEAVIMLLKHMESTKGKNFTIHSAEQLAIQMASEGVRTFEEAEEFLSRDQQVFNGTKEVLKKLGKRNAPSEGQQKLYQKWTREWGFTHRAILSACEETAKGDPNMGYLDGVLNRIYMRSHGDEKIDAGLISKDKKKSDLIRNVLKVLGKGTLNEYTVNWYDRLNREYDTEMILLSARECGRTGGDQEDMNKLLSSWKSRGITTAEQAEAYILSFRAHSAFYQELCEKWGIRSRMSEKERKMISLWLDERKTDHSLIMFAADQATGAAKPMEYLNKILESYADKHIETVSEAQEEQQRHKKQTTKNSEEKVLPAQQYTQRDYSREQETLDEMMARLNGGVVPHA